VGEEVVDGSRCGKRRARDYLDVEEDLPLLAVGLGVGYLVPKMGKRTRRIVKFPALLLLLPLLLYYY